MHLDPIIPVLLGAGLIILVIGLALQRFKQPAVVGYILAGVILGPYGFKLFTDLEVVSRLGAIGVVLLLFFVGMEISVPGILANWRVSVLGTVIQIIVSVACVAGIGLFFNWSVARSVLLGFVVSLSSTAVVIKLLQDWKELDTGVGRDVLGILLVQDMAMIPMLILVGYFGGEKVGPLQLGLQVAGGLVLLTLLFFATKGRFTLPFGKHLRADHELQVFSAFVLCFGLAFFTGTLGLSSALGAFVAGILLAAMKETKWVHDSLSPFRVVFVAVFFMSVGMLIDLEFLQRRWLMVLLLVLAALLTNTLINAVILRLLERTWKDSLYAGALLSQIGEFSFVLAAIGQQTRLITEFAYDATIAVISLTLLVSPAWIVLIKRMSKRSSG